jgi:RNA polymerase sigma-70 factor (ECF subfamily)
VARRHWYAQLSLERPAGHLPPDGCDELRGPHSYLSVPLSDADVVRRVLAGDTDAYALLVERYYQRCARYAVHVVGNREDAEEAVQDTLLRAFKSLDRYEERGQFGPWLFSILANQCRSVIARIARREQTFPDVYSDDVGHERALPDDHTSLPIADETTAYRLEQALATLPADQREALALRFGEAMTYDEMSAITGVGVSALKMRVSRATARLRALFTEVNHV